MMQVEKRWKMDERRQFLKLLARGILFTGLVGMGGALIMRENSGEEAPCDFDFICKNCRKRNTCELPEAKTQRSSTSNDKQEAL